MALTKVEKKALTVPGILALVIMGFLGYSWHLSSQTSMLQEMTDRTNAKIREGRSTLQSLEELDAKELFSLQHQLDEWIPDFENFVEVKLYLTQRIHAGLSAVGAKERDWSLSPPKAGITPFLGTVQVDALFPSYAALLRFIREMEDRPPPLLPQVIAVQKDGITIEVSLMTYFAYRLKDETA